MNRSHLCGADSYVLRKCVQRFEDNILTFVRKLFTSGFLTNKIKGFKVFIPSGDFCSDLLEGPLLPKITPAIFPRHIFPLSLAASLLCLPYPLDGGIHPNSPGLSVNRIFLSITVCFGAGDKLCQRLPGGFSLPFAVTTTVLWDRAVLGNFGTGGARCSVRAVVVNPHAWMGSGGGQ
jgi:hypothetical protein